MTQEPEHYRPQPLPPRGDAPTGGHRPGTFQPGGFQPDGFQPDGFRQGGFPPPPQGAVPGQPRARTADTPMFGRRSLLLSYLLWFLLGGLGGHKFYLSQPIQGVLYLLIFAFGWLTTPILIGWLILGVWGVLMLVDIVMVPVRVAQLNSRPPREG